MILSDVLYGDFEVDEPIIEELINAPVFQRLKGIRSGSYYPAAPYVAGIVTRYEHSIGVFLLLRKFGASLEEQICGLLHDVSHGAFSHTLDYLIKDKRVRQEQLHQDMIHIDFVKNSELAGILSKYGYNLDYLLDESHFSLLEQKSPNICADRIDYSLRDMYYYRPEDLSLLKSFIDDLMVYDNRLVFKNFEKADAFSKLFAFCDLHFWSNIGSAVMHHLVSQMLEHALNHGYLTFDELYCLGNQQVIDRLTETKDPVLQNILRQLDLPPEAFVSQNESIAETVCCKVRRIDPCFLDGKQLKTVSETDANYAEHIKKLPKFNEHKLNFAV